MADRLRLLRQEVQRAIEGDIPDAGLCAEAVGWLFQCDHRAPFAMAIGRLTGISIDDQSAPAVWRHALEIQHRWSGRLREAVTMRAAATEAVLRAREIEAPSAETTAPSLQPYLDRDLLTGLFNRPFYEKRLPEELEQAGRTGQPVSLVLLELGGIEELELSLTRSDYDDLLRTIGEQIRFHFRPTDLPCRTGDFQFSVILPATPANVAHAMADSFVEVTGHRHRGQPLTVEVGIATYRDDATSARGLERAAAAALRRALTISEGVASYSQRRDRQRNTESSSTRFKPGPGQVAGTVVLTVLGLSAVGFSVTHQFWGQPDETITPPPAAPHAAPVTRAPSSHHAAPVAASHSAGPGLPALLLDAARPRVDGDYHGAAARLQAIAAKPPGKGAGAPDAGAKTADALAAEALTAEALTAAAAADAAAGRDPSADLHRAALAAATGPSNGVRTQVALTRADWLERQKSPMASIAGFRAALAAATNPREKSAAAVGLIDAEGAAGLGSQSGAAATSLATEQGDPSVRAAYQILAAEAGGRDEDSLQLMLVQPAVLGVPGPVGEAVTDALARAMTPTAAAAQGAWKAPLQAIAASGQAPRAGTARLRLDLANRLLAWGVPGSAHALLAPDLAGSSGSHGGPVRSGIGLTLGPAAESRALFLDGVAQEELASPAGAKNRWIAAIKDRATLPPDLFTPAPDEQWWAAAASMMLGQESTAAFRHLMLLEGQPRARDGAWYLQLAARPGKRIMGPRDLPASVRHFVRGRRLQRFPAARWARRPATYGYAPHYRRPAADRYPAAGRYPASNRFAPAQRNPAGFSRPGIARSRRPLRSHLPGLYRRPARGMRAARYRRPTRYGRPLTRRWGAQYGRP